MVRAEHRRAQLCGASGAPCGRRGSWQARASRTETPRGTPASPSPAAGAAGEAEHDASAARQQPAALRCTHHRLLGRRAVRLLVRRAQQRPAAAQRCFSALHRGRCAALSRRRTHCTTSWSVTGRILARSPPAASSGSFLRAAASMRAREAPPRHATATGPGVAPRKRSARQFGSSFAFSTGVAGGSAFTIRYGVACTSFCRS